MANPSAARAAPDSDRVLEIVRRFKAPREVVWRAFTDAATFQKWWGPQGFTCPSATLDVRVGGRYRAEMLSPDGNLFVVGGVYREVKRPELRVYSWAWETGEMAGFETAVRIEFHAAGAETELRLSHRLFATAEARDKHMGGWTGCLDRLAQLAES